MPEPKSLRPLASGATQKVCSLSGVQGKISAEKLITLQDIEGSLLLSIKEAEQASSDARFWAKATIAAKFVKIACDVTITILAENTGIAGQAVGIVYDRAALVTDGLNGSLDTRAIMQHIGETHVDAFTAVLKDVGKEKISSAIGHSKTLLKTGSATLDLYREVSAYSSTDSGIKGAKKALISQLERTRLKIRETQMALNSCGLQ